MRRRTPQHSYTFDLLWKDGQDLRGLPLIQRKRLLKKIVKSPVLFVDHLVGHGVDLFQAVCEKDLGGILAKAAQGLYQPERTTWVKIKNRNYSQAEPQRLIRCSPKTGHSIWKNSAVTCRMKKDATEAAYAGVQRG